MQTTELKVEGMSCSNCALSVSNYLKKEGLQDVQVNPITGAVSFTSEADSPIIKLSAGIKKLGYNVVDETAGDTPKKPTLLSNNKQQLVRLSAHAHQPLNNQGNVLFSLQRNKRELLPLSLVGLFQNANLELLESDPQHIDVYDAQGNCLIISPFRVLLILAQQHIVS